MPTYLEDELATRGLGASDRPKISKGGAQGSFTQAATLATFTSATKGDWWLYAGTDGFALGGQTWNAGDTLECVATFTGAPADLTTSFVRVALPSACSAALIAAKVNTSQIGANGGAASLDSTGKLVMAQIPDAIVAGLKWQGTWDANANNPTIPAVAPGNNGWFYRVSVAGTTVIGGTSITFGVGDWLISNGTAWQRIANTLASATTTTQGTIQLGGDFDSSSTAAAPKIGALKGITLPASAPTAARQFLLSSSTSALAYGTLTAADLPGANGTTQGAITLAGDLAGTAASPSVAKIGGASVPGSAPTKAGQVLRTSSASATVWADSPVDGLIYAAQYASFDTLVTAINAATGTTIAVDFTGVSSLTCTADATINKQVVLLGNGATIKSGAATPGATATDWVLTNSYAAGARVRRPNNRVYVANAAIGASTAFVVGTTGATWKAEAPIITFTATAYVERLVFNTGDQVIFQGLRSNLRDVTGTTTNIVMSGSDSTVHHCWFNCSVDQAILGTGVVRTTQTSGTAWALANAYVVDDVVLQSSKLYRANSDIAANTAFATGSAANQWHPVFYDSTAAYPAGAIVLDGTAGIYYEANAAIPANTTFATGTSGATWLPLGGPAMLTIDALGVIVTATQFAYDNNQGRNNAITITESGNRPTIRDCVVGNLSNSAALANHIAMVSFGNVGIGNADISGNTFYGAYKNAWIWFAGKTAKWYSHITDNYYEGYATSAATGPRSKVLWLEGIHGCYIAGNAMANIHLQGAWIRYSDDWKFADNVAPGSGILGTSSTFYVFYAARCNRGVIQSNRLIVFDTTGNTGAAYGIYLTGCDSIVSISNQLRGATNIATNGGIAHTSTATNCQHYNNIFYNNTKFSTRFDNGTVTSNVEVGTQALLP